MWTQMSLTRYQLLRKRVIQIAKTDTKNPRLYRLVLEISFLFNWMAMNNTDKEFLKNRKHILKSLHLWKANIESCNTDWYQFIFIFYDDKV